MTITALAWLLLPVFGTVLAGWTLARVAALPARLTDAFQRLTFDVLLPLLLSIRPTALRRCINVPST